MTHVVFVGPSLPPNEVRALHPKALVYPPVRQGDIVSVLREHAPTAIGIIDGVFLDVLSVWHKEILLALDEGVAVLGAASMGALRAAECAPYGMQGVGTIFQMYADGRLTRDDEVAVIHTTEEFGFKAMSEPLVNLRLNLQRAAATGVIGHDLAAALLDEAADTYFPDRSWSQVFASPLLDSDTGNLLRQFVTEQAVDHKAADARELLTTMAAARPQHTGDEQQGGTDDPAPTRPLDHQPWQLERSHYLMAMTDRDRWSVRQGEQIGQESIYRFIMANDPSAPQRMNTALVEMLALYAAKELGIDPDDDDVVKARTDVCADLGIDQAEIGDFCTDNNITKEEFDEVIVDRARIDKAADWLIRTRFKLGAVQPLLNSYRFSGLYPQWADAAAMAQTLTGRGEDGLPRPSVPPSTRHTATELRQHSAETGWTTGRDDVQGWTRRHGFIHEKALLSEVERSRAYRAMMAAALRAADSLTEHSDVDHDNHEVQP